MQTLNLFRNIAVLRLSAFIILSLFAKSSSAYEIIFDRIPSSAGLRSEFILSVGQSDDGFIWVGTQSGLQRYDGYRMANFFNEDPSKRIPSKPIEQILNSGYKNLLWIRTSTTIGLFNTQTFVYSPVKIACTSPSDMKIHRSKDGKTYLYLRNRGILVYNGKKKAFVSDQTLNNMLKDFKPAAIHFLPNGNFYVAGQNGLGYYDQISKTFSTAQSNIANDTIIKSTASLRWIRLFFIDSKGRTFIQTWPPKDGQKMFMIRKASNKIQEITLNPIIKGSYFEVNEVVENNGIVWALGVGIFCIFEDEGSSFIHFYDYKSPTYGISSTHILQMFQDKDQNLWLATNDGLYMTFVVGNYIRNASYSKFTSSDLTSVLKLPDRNFLVGSWGLGIQAFSYDDQYVLINDTSVYHSIYAQVPKSDEQFKMVWDMAIDQSKIIWIGCQNGRLIRYDSKNRTSTFYVPAVFSEQSIRAIVVDKHNQVWFGTQGGKLIRSDNERFIEVMDFGVTISQLYLDKDDNIWIATGGKGLTKLSTTSYRVMKRYNAESQFSLSSNQVTSITQVNDSTIAIACDANLDLLNLKTGKIENLNPYNGLEHSIISSLTTDRHGNLWMTSNGGIVRYNLYKRRFRYYDQKDGMVNTSAVANLPYISEQFDDNTLFFASEKNFMMFQPDSLNRRFIPKDVTITGFRLINNYIPLSEIVKDHKIKLQANQNVFTITFSSLSFKQAKQLKYFYSFQDGEDKWIEAENGQSVSFTSLSPGDYTFKVYAINQEDIRSPLITSLNIEIVPRFYQTKVFLFLLFIIGLAPVIIIYRLRLKRTMELYKLREKVARDLHDDMGSTLTSINILSVVAQRDLEEQQGNALDCMKKIGQNSSQMMESMDDIVWSIKPDNDQLSRIMVRLREHTTQILEPQNIEYNFIAEDQLSLIVLPMDVRRNLFLIYKEALNNISKYALATHVTIKIIKEKKALKVSITDNGVGFNMKILTDGNGLMNMRKRAELIKGSLEINSALGKGTSLKLTIPVNK